MPRGSKPGERRGGRAKGVKNKKTQAQIEAVEATGITPLNYLLTLMRDVSQEPVLRFEAAKAAAPYVHPKLAQVAHQGVEGGPAINLVISKTDADL